MAKYIFPAVFTWSDEDKTYYVTFPDVDGCFTDGATVTEAMENADDVLNLMIHHMETTGMDIPKATALEDVPAPGKGFVNLIMADTVAYQEVIDRENNFFVLEIKKHRWCFFMPLLHQYRQHKYNILTKHQHLAPGIVLFAIL